MSRIASELLSLGRKEGEAGDGEPLYRLYGTPKDILWYVLLRVRVCNISVGALLILYHPKTRWSEPLLRLSRLFVRVAEDLTNYHHFLHFVSCLLPVEDHGVLILEAQSSSILCRDESDRGRNLLLVYRSSSQPIPALPTLVHRVPRVDDSRRRP
jgi:hypothetical protein